MKRRALIACWLTAAVAVVGAGALAGIATAAGDPAPAVKSTPTAVAWPSTSAETPRPKREEWSAAEKLDLPRPHEHCSATRLREWVRISCEPSVGYMGVRVVAGSHAEVKIEDRKRDKGDAARDAGVDVIFPVRRGDRRLIEIAYWFSAGFKSYAIEEDVAVMISETWLDDALAPTLVVD